MHPLLANPRRLAVYVAAWFPFVSVLFVTFREAAPVDPPSAILLSLIMAPLYAVLALSALYSCRLAPLRSSSIWQVARTQAAAAASSTVVWLLFGAIAAFLIEHVADRGDLIAGYGRALPALIGIVLPLFAMSVAVHYLYIAVEQSRAAERRALELQVVAREAELKVLRAQIDPHFLFNCLHSIAALTTTEPAAARKMCVLLGDFLRTSLKVGQHRFVSMTEELALVRSYLAIEQVRLGARLEIAEHTQPGLNGLQVPPLLLHPLVENAITHGIGHLIEGGIVEINASIDEQGRPHLVVANTCDPDRPRRAGTGVGIENVRRRLDTVYAHEASLSTREQPHRFEAEIVLPAQSTEAQV
jgi:hypothetical protein